MKPVYPDQDTTPWYRQFWPWFLIALPGTVVVVSFHLMYTAYKHSDDLVVDEYYKVGLAINRQLERKERAGELALAAQFTITEHQVTARLEGPVTADTLELTFSHPMEADRDFSVALQRVGPGIYNGQLQTAVAERWHWILSDAAGNEWRLDGVVRAEDLLADDS
ncbi:FixH family protein [Haliea sp. E1-2-M8]|uniref:FixH family protein n=1 Tax=Haliea sp. E1-2-M8 TaxID=3064706 RepID=UPI00271F66EC|nr:FixH family protein [Haliea sp. E1-2-M8]MDO8860732.1 FixH family protein [Haliea sp. E1-2-M8]